MSFVILVLAGFLLTPGVFNVINPEYLLALHQYGAPLEELRHNIANNNLAITNLDDEIASLQKDQAEQTIAATTQQAALSAANASDQEIAQAAIKAGAKLASITNALAEAKKRKENLMSKNETLEKSAVNLTEKIDATKSDSINIYTVTRALALGAIGALMSILANFLSTRKRSEVVTDNYAPTTIAASMAMGAIVSVVVVGLFYTGFISIFSNATQIAGNPDFWKVTILCLLAGAFSDRLFQAAATRVGRYVESAGGSPPSGGNAGS